MALSKLFQRIFWHNNTTPAINEDNLNAMSKAIDDIDNRVIALGDNVMTVVPQIQAYLEQAEDLVEAMELLSQNPPYIGQNGNWWVWDTNTSAFVDSGVDASISVDIADITMLAPNAEPYVTNSGTDTDPIFHLFIPRGQTGNGISTIAKTGTSGLVDTYTITMTDGTTSTFTVTNGAGDMNKSVYDPTNAIANAGGMKSAAAKDSTNAVTANSTDLVESGAVYAKTEPLLANILRNGAVNLCRNDLVVGTQYTVNNVTITVNADKSITLNGTANNAFNFWLTSNHAFDATKTTRVKAGKYAIGINSSPYNTNKKWTFGEVINGSFTALKYVNDVYQIFNLDHDADCAMYLMVINGTSFNNETFSPIIIPEELWNLDPSYVPYAMNNRELTEEVTSITSELNKGARQKLFRMTTNTKLVAKVRKTAVVSWGQMVLRFVGTNNGKYYDSIAYAQFNSDGTAVSSSRIVNLADADPTLTVSFDSDYLIITIGNLTNYVILALDYYDNGMYNSPNHEDWVFSQES